jgi:hypothetical protein
MEFQQLVLIMLVRLITTIHDFKLAVTTLYLMEVHVFDRLGQLSALRLSFERVDNWSGRSTG